MSSEQRELVNKIITSRKHDPVDEEWAFPDPWLPRSAKMRCERCMWYVEKKSPVGRCRRHAPTMGGYPVVFENDWCGDHKLDEQ